MVEQQVRPWEVLDQRVLNLAGEMPRDAFVPDAYRGLAYADIEIPLGGTQHMMFPRVECRLLQALNIQPSDTVLEIGTGSGYLTACLARLGKEVVSLDTHANFIEQAGERLNALGINNVKLINQDGFEAIEGGPFDVIAITGSLPKMVDSFKELLSEGGRLFVVTGEGPAMEASLITRVSEDAWRSEGLFETEIAPLENAPQNEQFSF